MRLPTYEAMIGFMGFKAYVEERARALAITTEVVPLSELLPDWQVSENSVSRPDGSFYTVGGVVHQQGENARRVKQPFVMGVQPGVHGYVALIISDGRILIRMKAEPGNDGIKVDGKDTCVLVSPTLQFSRASIELHQLAVSGVLDPTGKPYAKVPLCNVVTDGKLVKSVDDPDAYLVWQKVAKDGGRFFKQNNLHAIIEVGEFQIESEISALGEGAKDFAWVTEKVLANCMMQGIINEHCRSVLAMLWARGK